MKRIIILAIISIFITGCGLIPQSESIINSFDECIAAGYPAMESYPRQCSDGNKSFTEYIGNELEKGELIRLDSPRPNEIIVSPITISGEAVGNWFFEGDFPIELFDADGTLLGTGYATADGEWMTENFVKFKTDIEFIKPTSNNGLLILRKDNPSDIPLYNDSLEVPVKF